MKGLFISFVLAAYNERNSVLPLLERISAAMGKIPVLYELIFIVEGDDGTIEILRQYKKDHPTVKIRLVYQHAPLGLTGAIQKGILEVSKKATHVVMMDVDLNHNPNELPKLLEKAKEGYNIVIGSRVHGVIKDVPLWRKTISFFANRVFNMVFKVGVVDKTSGFRVIDVKTAREIAPMLTSRNFEGLIEFLLIAHSMKKSMVEVPVTLTFRQYGKTKFRLFGMAKGYARLLLKKYSAKNY